MAQHKCARCEKWVSDSEAVVAPHPDNNGGLPDLRWHPACWSAEVRSVKQSAKGVVRGDSVKTKEDTAQEDAAQ